MASSLESRAFFESRCKTVGLSEENITRLIDAGVVSLANLAFFCSYQPGAPDDTPLVQAATRVLNQDPLPGGVLIALRRLHYEAHAMYIADLKLKVASTSEDVPKQVPAAERAARHEEQRARITGILLEGEFECSHGLLDQTTQQYERDELRYIQVAQCTSRDQELSGRKRDAALALDAEGQLQVKPSTVHVIADTSTELKLKNALTRRGLAYDQTGLLTFEVHMKWVEKLFSIMQRTVPPGFRSIGISQLLEADRELWRRMAEECRSGIVPQIGAARPMDGAMAALMNSSEVAYYLLPLPLPSGRSGSSLPSDTPLHSMPVANKLVKNGGKKGGGKSEKKYAPLPDGCVTKTKEGKKICFPFNTADGCRYAKPGQQCRRGFHLCAKKGCQGKHSATGCGASSN